MGQPGEPYDPNAAYQPGAGEPAYPQPGYPQPGYPQPGYPQPGYTPPGYAQPAYAPPGYPPPGYPPPGYPAPYPYPGYPPAYGRPARPSTTTTACVLAYVCAGLLIAAGLLLFLGASVVDGLDNLDEEGHSLVTAELVIDGLLNMVSGGLLIAGAVSFGGRSLTGRIMLSVGGGIVLGESVYWLVRTSNNGGAVFWALLFAALVVVALSMAWTSASTRWLRTSA